MNPVDCLEKIANASELIKGCQRLKGTKNDDMELEFLEREARLTKNRYLNEFNSMLRPVL